MQENIDTFPIQNTKETKIDIESRISLIKGSGTLSGANLVRQYKMLMPEARKIATEEIERYISALDRVDYFDDVQKQKELSAGIYEIIEDAKIGRRARIDLAPSEHMIDLTISELDNAERESEEEKIENEEERKLVEKIKAKYREIFEKEKK